MPHTTPHKPESHAHLRKYPWPELAAGKTVTLTQGVHFTCQPATVRDMAHKAAGYRGMKARTSTRGGKITIRFEKKGAIDE